MNRKTKLYLVVSFAWTWFGWGVAYLISHLQGSTLLLDLTIFNLWEDAWGSNRLLPQVLFAFAVYGPFVGFMVTRGYKNLRYNAEGSKKLWHYMILIPLISVLPSIALSLAASHYNPKSTFVVLMTSIFLYFISNLITSGTEEFGWRGVLYPEMKARGMSFWDIAWKGGFIWAIWHFPLLVIMYIPFGVAVLIPSLVGFVASIVAMNYITNFLYEKTRNIWFAVILHGLNNTMSFVVVLLFPETPFIILSSLMAWVIVWWIERKNPKIMPKLGDY